MMSQAGRILSKVAALGLLAAAMAAVWLVAVVPVMSRISGLEADIAEQRTFLGRLQLEAAMIADEPTMEAAGGVDGRQRGAFLDGNSEAERLALLQAHLDRIALAAGLSVSSSQSIAGPEVEGVEFLGVQVQLSGEIDSVQRVLHEIETGTPALVVDGIDIVHQPVAPGEADAALDVRVKVLGAVPPPDTVQQGSVAP